MNKITDMISKDQIKKWGKKWFNSWYLVQLPFTIVKYFSNILIPNSNDSCFCFLKFLYQGTKTLWNELVILKYTPAKPWGRMISFTSNNDVEMFVYVNRSLRWAVLPKRTNLERCYSDTESMNVATGLSDQPSNFESFSSFNRLSEFDNVIELNNYTEIFCKGSFSLESSNSPALPYGFK